ncbi:MAG: hypothetical protein M3P83_02955 [Actinomycetota bacterium]|nr:hypothetical protein [Actinomycetota bacterium]
MHAADHPIHQWPGEASPSGQPGMEQGMKTLLIIVVVVVVVLLVLGFLRRR